MSQIMTPDISQMPIPNFFAVSTSTDLTKASRSHTEADPSKRKQEEIENDSSMTASHSDKS